ncbi:unnamed protein product, partial [Darwinula stevensoni]
CPLPIRWKAASACVVARDMKYVDCKNCFEAVSEGNLQKLASTLEFARMIEINGDFEWIRRYSDYELCMVLDYELCMVLDYELCLVHDVDMHLSKQFIVTILLCPSQKVVNKTGTTQAALADETSGIGKCVQDRLSQNFEYCRRILNGEVAMPNGTDISGRMGRMMSGMMSMLGLSDADQKSLLRIMQAMKCLDVTGRATLDAQCRQQSGVSNDPTFDKLNTAHQCVHDKVDKAYMAMYPQANPTVRSFADDVDTDTDAQGS